MTQKAPALFLSHGSPMIALEDDAYTAALERLGRDIHRPRAVVALSAHWESPLPVRVTAAEEPALIYDFGGFPEELYQMTYPCPGDLSLARDIVLRLSEIGLSAELDKRRGLDHGVWTPLRRLFPAADIPVLQISLPSPREPQSVFQMGQALQPLRSAGVLLMGTGGVVHNLRRLRLENKNAPADDWAEAFDRWVQDNVRRKDFAALMNYRDEGPRAELAVQGPEHFDPLLFAWAPREPTI